MNEKSSKMNEKSNEKLILGIYVRKNRKLLIYEK